MARVALDAPEQPVAVVRAAASVSQVTRHRVKSISATSVAQSGRIFNAATVAVLFARIATVVGGRHTAYSRL